MRIGIYDPYLDDLGGGEKYMMMLASCLSKKHEVTVFWNNVNDIKALEKRFGFSLETINISKNIFSPSVSFLEKRKAFRNYDAFVVLSDGSIPFVFPKKLYLHIQQPLTRHNLNFKEKIKIKHISTIFYNSHFTKRFNDPLFPGVKSKVIYPPVSFGKNDKGTIERKENIILHVGRFRVKSLANEDYKKQGFMIEAFKKLIDDGLKNWHFVLASSVKKEDEAAFNKLKESARGYPIKFFINNTSQELIAVYKKTKIYWHASGYGEDIEKFPELAEHFGITTVEAMGEGAVPVVINSGGQKEIVTDGENGLLWNTLDELLKKTTSLVTDEKLWHELSKRATIRAQDFSEKKFFTEIQQLIIE